MRLAAARVRKSAIRGRISCKATVRSLLGLHRFVVRLEAPAAGRVSVRCWLALALAASERSWRGVR